LGEAAQRRAREFSIEAMVSRIEAIYDRDPYLVDDKER
jgi:hypothetical protein